MPASELETLIGSGLSQPRVAAGTRITEELWQAEHAVHDVRARIHSAALHGWGIVRGLEVTATHPPSPYVSIHPGLAYDPQGRAIAVTTAEHDQALRVFHAGAAPGWIHILLQHSEVGPTAVEVGEGNHLRVDVRAVCIASPRPPEPHQLELARVWVKSANAAIKEPADPWSPGEGDLDLRFRALAGARLRGEVVVGQFGQTVKGGFKWESFDLGRTPLALLLRHVRESCSYQTSYLPFIQLSGDENGCALLVTTGRDSLALAPEQVERLRVFVAAGGTVFAEGALPAFETAARALAEKLAVALTPVQAGHPLLSSRYVFAAPPPGGPTDLGGLFAGQASGGLGGVVLSTRDYLSAWAGKGNLERGRIRDAFEFGANLLIHAADTAARARLDRQAAPRQSAVG